MMRIRTREGAALEAVDTEHGSRTFPNLCHTTEHSGYWNRALLSNDRFCLNGTLAAQGQQLVVETQNSALLHISADM